MDIVYIFTNLIISQHRCNHYLLCITIYINETHTKTSEVQVDVYGRLADWKFKVVSYG